MLPVRPVTALLTLQKPSCECDRIHVTITVPPCQCLNVRRWIEPVLDTLRQASLNFYAALWALPPRDRLSLVVIPFLRWVWMLWLALSQGELILALKVFAVWCLLHSVLVAPLVTAIGVQDFAVKLAIFVSASYWVGKLILCLIFVLNYRH